MLIVSMLSEAGLFVTMLSDIILSVMAPLRRNSLANYRKKGFTRFPVFTRVSKQVISLNASLKKVLGMMELFEYDGSTRT